MNYIGAILLVAAGFYMGLSRARDQRIKVKTLRGVCLMLELIKSEICSRRTPMDELFAYLSYSGTVEIREFADSMRKKLRFLNEKAFSQLWCEAVERHLGNLPQDCLGTVCELGSSLGRYDADMQASAIERAQKTLSARLSVLETNLKADEKMYIALGCGVSLIAALVLI